MKRKLSPPPDKQNTPGIQFRITVVVVFFLMKRKLSPPPPDKQNTPGILYRDTEAFK